MNKERIAALRQQIASKNLEHPDSTVWMVVEELLDEIERHAPKTRPAVVDLDGNGETGRIGVFHGFGSEVIEGRPQDNEPNVQYTVAVMEFPDGSVMMAPPEKVRFLDRKET